ncbi:MAG: hypothetical protein A2566_03395 [Candidatus Zambryskibacteria bacterium RIFOXYD1_FULL_40_13]|nr:MAG: RNA polymerase, sigma-24 subunit, ECF subfamily [Parcubacteria group bacterium GW2011_GWC1_39_12]KKR19492.1 MAG: RNA polymerase, sigma-24 subunit, ECF subfamily [Parcubacteria group bacterium GW2011_GWF1_39_37]KKR35118.1 MAG: RNA polymerase, sigma-24 subunit, ECF subfamily [Parcubacteria group bacterium GW2011_GWC2_40_10]KKR52441.1 MAG: RNA polymerase, sigma-24 subunit, ECF subfamily [Parcubacteria group bacterium GW2011_GWE1_40_20]KKR65899.1 MAG: RNA polymerase, sigma-24 subunit, ECF s
MPISKDNLPLLWDTITPKLYGYLVNTLKDRVLAEDILQTTWLKAIQDLPRFESRAGASFSSWLFAIAINECKQHWRKSGREIPFDPILHDRGETDSATSDKILVEQILSLLSEDNREIIRLHYIAGLSTGEVAKVLKINPVTARVRMYRAMNLARTLLKNQQS